MGVEILTNTAVGSELGLDDLLGQGYRAIFIAIGAQLSTKTELEGDKLNGVFWGLDFLRDVNMGKEIAIKERVLVIGGGNVAVDVARTALRVGAEDITLACLERREEMPANPSVTLRQIAPSARTSLSAWVNSGKR